jgi:hypothetical protein
MVKPAEEGRKDCVAVAVSRFGHDPIPVKLDEGATVEDALSEAGVDLGENQQVFNAGAQVNMNDIVEDGDVLSIVSPKAAGAR